MRKSKTAAFLRWSLIVVATFVVIDLVYLAIIWPDWDSYRKGHIKQTSFIRDYISAQKRHPDWPRLRWTPVVYGNISRHMTRAAIVAEDANFYSHSGIDLEALRAAMETNLDKGRFAYGGSTISQQTVKNLFLSSSRNPLRKWHELVLTLAMEQQLSKRRILELYLNIVEFGRGIYGVEAAARHYWGIPASGLSRYQAIALAASLPAPVDHNPATRSRFFKQRVRKISRYF